MKLTIALAQMDIVFGAPADNLAGVRTLAAEAAARGAQLLLLPELWSTAYDLENADRHASAVDGGVFAALAELARRHQIHIAGSALSTLSSGGIGNTLTWHTPEGRLLGQYSKLHLFRLMAEEQYLTGGEAAALWATPWGPAGAAICYDLRFPELFRRYAVDGAVLAILPAEWPRPRLAHWRTLLRARAIENQMFMVACNRVGSAGETHFFGHSAIIDPWGETIVEAGEEEALLVAAIDTDLVADVRRRIPVFEDRRPEAY